jgi:hypothetical protein
MRGGFHKVCSHLVHAAQLHLGSGLVYARQGCPAKSHIQVVHPAGGVLNGSNAFAGSNVRLPSRIACWYEKTPDVTL